MPNVLTTTAEEVNSWADIVEKVLGIYFNGGKKFKNPLVWSCRTHKDKTMMTYIEHRGNGKARGPCRLPIGYNYEGMLIAIYELIFEFVDGPFDTQTFAEFKERCEQTLKKYKCKSALRHPNNEKKRNKSEAKLAFLKFLELKHNQLNEKKVTEAIKECLININNFIQDSSNFYAEARRNYLKQIGQESDYVEAVNFVKNCTKKYISRVPVFQEIPFNCHFVSKLEPLYNCVETLTKSTESRFFKKFQELLTSLEENLGVYREISLKILSIVRDPFFLRLRYLLLFEIAVPIHNTLHFEIQGSENLQTNIESLISNIGARKFDGFFDEMSQDGDKLLNWYLSEGLELNIEKKRTTLINCLENRISRKQEGESTDHFRHMKNILEAKRGKLTPEHVDKFTEEYSKYRVWITVFKYKSEISRGFFKGLEQSTSQTILALMSVMVDAGACGEHNKI